MYTNTQIFAHFVCLVIKHIYKLLMFNLSSQAFLLLSDHLFYPFPRTQFKTDLNETWHTSVSQKYTFNPFKLKLACSQSEGHICMCVCLSLLSWRFVM